MRSIPAVTARVAGAGALVLLAGCGGDDEQPGRTATVAGGEPIEVTGTDYAFDPETLVVEGGGGPLEIVLENEGSLPHNLTVFEGATQLGATAALQGGESDSASVRLEPGTYRLVCTIGDHEDLGMVGEIELR